MALLSLPSGHEAILLDPSGAQGLLLLRLRRQGLRARLRRPDRECIDPRGGRTYRRDVSDTARQSGAAETEANAKRPRRRSRPATAASAVSAHARSIASIPGRKTHQSRTRRNVRPRVLQSRHHAGSDLHPDPRRTRRARRIHRSLGQRRATGRCPEIRPAAPISKASRSLQPAPCHRRRASGPGRGILVGLPPSRSRRIGRLSHGANALRSSRRHFL